MKGLAEHGRLATDAIVGLRKPLGQLAVLSQRKPRLPRKTKKVMIRREFHFIIYRGDAKRIRRMIRWEEKTGYFWCARRLTPTNASWMKRVAAGSQVYEPYR